MIMVLPFQGHTYFYRVKLKSLDDICKTYVFKSIVILSLFMYIQYWILSIFNLINNTICFIFKNHNQEKIYMGKYINHFCSDIYLHLKSHGYHITATVVWLDKLVLSVTDIYFYCWSYFKSYYGIIMIRCYFKS